MMKAKFALGFLLVLGMGQAQAQGLNSVPLKNDPKLPALPKLDSSQPRRLQIREFQTYRGRVFQLEIIRQDKADVLKAIVAALGAECQFEGSSPKKFLAKSVYRAASLESLLSQVCGDDYTAIRFGPDKYILMLRTKVSSPGGAIVGKQQEDLSKPKGNSGIDPHFLIPLFPKRSGPPSHWERVPFNDGQYYVVPIPQGLSQTEIK